MNAIDRENMLGLVRLTERRIIDAIDSLGLDKPQEAALELAKALSSVRALDGELGGEAETDDQPAPTEGADGSH